MFAVACSISAPLLRRAGECAAFVTEEFGFDEGFRKRRKFTATNGFPNAGDLAWIFLRQQVFAGAAFAENQHVESVERRDRKFEGAAHFVRPPIIGRTGLPVASWRRSESFSCSSVASFKRLVTRWRSSSSSNP